MLDEFGDTYLTLGDLGEALASYRDSLAIAERLAAADRSNTQWQRDLSLSYDNVGSVLVAQGKLEEALTAYRDGLAIGERLAAADRFLTESPSVDRSRIASSVVLQVQMERPVCDSSIMLWFGIR